MKKQYKFLYQQKDLTWRNIKAILLLFLFDHAQQLILQSGIHKIDFLGLLPLQAFILYIDFHLFHFRKYHRFQFQCYYLHHNVLVSHVSFN